MNDINGITAKLKQWRINRNLENYPYDYKVHVANLLEEYTELLRAKDIYEAIDAWCDIAVFSLNVVKDDFSVSGLGGEQYHFLSVVSAIESWRDDYQQSIGMYHKLIDTSMISVLELGYDWEKCMLETIKEIGSRLQDPVQMADWAKNGASGKWQKWKDQSKSTLYKADYSKCKLKVGKL